MLYILKDRIKHLLPAYFGMVMATGIVSCACYFLNMNSIAYPLFWLNIAFYFILCVFTIIRIFGYTEFLVKDILDHVKGMGFFTLVTATSLIGTQFILLENNYDIAVIFWYVALILWLIITYTIFTNLTIKSDKPSFSDGINGSWLLAVVSTQSLAILSGKLSMHFTDYKLLLNFFAFALWLWGGMLYIWMISLIFYRYTFFKFSPSDLTPPYWINMGAMAISTLAGSVLIINTPHAPFLNSTLAFLKGFTIFYWVTGTWWIPMLIILALWRHVYKRFPLTYDPLFWGAVFPLGMYTACTYEMAEAMDLPFLKVIPQYFIFIALIAWGATFIGLIRTIFKDIYLAKNSI
jgi:tellurite resistance protein TehA-like permease